MKKFLLIAVVIGVVALVARKLSAGRDDWTNLTEEEARQRLDDRFPSRMPEDKKEVVTDKIVSRMREKGAIIDLTDDAEVEGVDAPAEESAASN